MRSFLKKTTDKGFTLVELLVTIAIIAILTAIIIGGLNGSRKKSRDAQRQVDLAKVQVVLEAYREVNGSYPLNSACDPGDNSEWSGPGPATLGGNFMDSCDDYIPGLVPSFLPSLPLDPTHEFEDMLGYRYRSDGNEYKLSIHRTVESEEVTPDHQFAMCSGSCSGTNPQCAITGNTYDSEVARKTYSIYTAGGECW